jgi:viologen exporter family transport system permease protein
MRIWKLIRAFLRVGVTGEITYRVNFWWQAFQSVLGLGVALAGLSIIFSYTGSLGGWSIDEILALVGVYFLVGGFIGFIIQPGMETFIASVRDGSMDFLLEKPADAQLLVSVQSVDIWKIVDILMGIGLLAYALARVGANIGPGEAGIFIAMLACGGVIVYCFWLMLATLSFWFVRVENILVIFQSLYEAGRWPLSLYPGWLRYGLTFIVPVAFAVTVPAEALTGRLNLVDLIIALGIAVFLVILSRAFWKFGLRRYSSASS